MVGPTAVVAVEDHRGELVVVDPRDPNTYPTGVDHFRLPPQLPTPRCSRQGNNVNPTAWTDREDPRHRCKVEKPFHDLKAFCI